MAYVVFNKNRGYVAKRSGFAWDLKNAAEWPYRAACRVAQSVARRFRAVAQVQTLEQARRPLPVPKDWVRIEIENGRSPITGRPWGGLSIGHGGRVPVLPRPEQNKLTSAKAAELDRQIEALVESGILVCKESRGRKYTY